MNWRSIWKNKILPQVAFCYLGEIILFLWRFLRNINLIKSLFDLFNWGNFETISFGMMLFSHPLKTIFQHKACTDKLYADSFYKVQKNSHSSFEVICKSGKTKCDALIKRNVIFSCKTKCNKMETHTIPKGWFEPNIQTDLFLYIEFKLHILISVK